MAANLPLIGQVGRRGLSIPLNAFRDRVGGDAALKKILRGLTITEKVTCAGGRPKGLARAVRHAYVIDRAGFLIIPRIKGPLLLKTRGPHGLPLLDRIRHFNPEQNAGQNPGQNAAPDLPLPPTRKIDPASCEPDEPLYEYQEAAVAYICQEEQAAAEQAAAEQAAEPRTIYLQMDTGLGKTRVGCAIIARRAEPALIVVPTEAIAFQWLDELSESYPGLRGALYRNEDERKATAAAARGKAATPAAGPLTHDMVVVIINTFRDKSPDFLVGYGIVILDEAHELHSVHNSRALWLAQARLVVGLSATPLERPDGLDRYVCMHLGIPIRPMDIPGGATTAVNFRGEVRMIEYAGKPGDPCCETVTGAAGTMSAILTIGRVLSDAARRRMIAEEVRRLLHAHEEWPAEEQQRCGLGPRPASAATPHLPEGGMRRHGVFVFAELREALPQLREELEKVLGVGAVIVPELAALAGPGLALAGPGRGNELEETDNTLEETDNTLEETDNTLEETDNTLEETDNTLEETDNTLEETDNTLETIEENNVLVDSLEIDDIIMPRPGPARADDIMLPRPGPARAISILRGGVARDAVGKARAAGAHVVLTTYGFSRRGISLPDMTALVLASPRRHGSTQTLGRILRRGSDESILRVIVDVVDVCTGLKSQSTERKRAYTMKGYPVTKIKYSYEGFPEPAGAPVGSPAGALVGAPAGAPVGAPAGAPVAGAPGSNWGAEDLEPLLSDQSTEELLADLIAGASKL